MSTFHHLAILASLLATTAGLTPLTKIKATEVELAAFSKTAKGALDELFPTKPCPVLHIVGASDVESNVDWSDLCSRGATVVLVGPEAVIPRESSAGGSECVTVVKELYSVTKMARDGATPDLLLLLNADLYTYVCMHSNTRSSYLCAYCTARSFLVTDTWLSICLSIFLAVDVNNRQTYTCTHALTRAQPNQPTHPRFIICIGTTPSIRLRVLPPF